VSYRVVVRPEAEADMAEGFDWYEDRRDGLGQEFLAEVKAVFKMIEDNPLRHAVMYRNVRRALVRKFPYKVFYYLEADRAEVIGVVHAKRHPRFWQQRV
jgi:plasmid stabilization system protein ParE